MSRIDFLKKQIQGSSLIAPLDGVVSEIYARKGEMIKKRGTDFIYLPII